AAEVIAREGLVDDPHARDRMARRVERRRRVAAAEITALEQADAEGGEESGQNAERVRGLRLRGAGAAAARGVPALRTEQRPPRPRRPAVVRPSRATASIARPGLRVWSRPPAPARGRTRTRTTATTADRTSPGRGRPRRARTRRRSSARRAAP